MTIDLSALEADLSAAPSSRGNRCAVQDLVARYPEAEEVLRRAINDLTRSCAGQARILSRNGLKISESAIKRHRDGTCQQCKEESAA